MSASAVEWVGAIAAVANLGLIVVNFRTYSSARKTLAKAEALEQYRQAMVGVQGDILQIVADTHRAETAIVTAAHPPAAAILEHARSVARSPSRH